MTVPIGSFGGVCVCTLITFTERFRHVQVHRILLSSALPKMLSQEEVRDRLRIKIRLHTHTYMHMRTFFML